MPTTERWRFDESVAACFDDMLARSIPCLDTMRRAVHELAVAYRQENTAIVDLGCAHGAQLSPLVDAFGVHNRFVGVDTSAPMLRAARERFGGLVGTDYPRSSCVDLRDMDLRRDYPPVKASVTLAVLTLQFIPIEYRAQIVRRVWEHTLPGGAFLLVEKVLGATGLLADTFIAQYHALKRRNGYSDEEIRRKALSLEGALVPVTSAWNEDLLRAAGFTHIDGFWRWMNFAGWVAVKD